MGNLGGCDANIKAFIKLVQILLLPIPGGAQVGIDSLQHARVVFFRQSSLFCAMPRKSLRLQKTLKIFLDKAEQPYLVWPRSIF